MDVETGSAVPAARVRGAARDAEILQATLDLLASDGYDQLTMDAVAARARAGKATLYRRWENKAQLVLDALEQLEEVPVTPCGADTGSLRGDLMALVCERPGQLVQQRFAVVCGLFTALHRSPELAGAFKLRFLKRRLAELDAAFARAAARGELRPDCPVDLVALILPAMGMLYGMTTAGQFDLAYLGRVVDEVVLPLALAGGLD